MHCETLEAYTTHRAVAIGFRLTPSTRSTKASIILAVAVLTTDAVRLRQTSARGDYVYHPYTSQRSDDPTTLSEATPQTDELFGESTLNKS